MLLTYLGNALCFFFKQKTAYEMRISDWSSDVCSSDLLRRRCAQRPQPIGNHIEGNLMADTLTADDHRYRAMFDVANEAASHGDGHVHGDLTPLMSQLRERAPVLNSSLRQLLDLPPMPHDYSEHRQQIGRAHVGTPVTNSHRV